MGEAVRQLTATVAAGATTHPCDVRLGRDIVAVLEAAERFLSEGDGGGRYMAVPRNEAPGVTRR
jgi:hypothetical protein